MLIEDILKGMHVIFSKQRKSHQARTFCVAQQVI